MVRIIKQASSRQRALITQNDYGDGHALLEKIIEV